MAQISSAARLASVAAVATLLLLCVVSVSLVDAQAPAVPQVMAAEWEFTVPNISGTFALYEKVDMVRNLSYARFKVGRNGEDDVVIQDWNTGKAYLIDEDQKCHKVDDAPNHAEVFVLTRAILMTAHPSARFLYKDSIRGISCDVYGTNGYQVNEQGITGVLDNILWYFSDEDWNVKYATGPQLVGGSMEGNLQGGNWTSIKLFFTIVDVSPSRALAEDTFSIPPACGEGATAVPNATDGNTTTGAPVVDVPNPMPKLPETFTATIETNMKEQQATFTLQQWYSQPLSASHTRWVRSALDSYERQVANDVYIVGTFQLAYELVTAEVPQGKESTFNVNERAMFFPDTRTCSKNVFNTNIAGSMDDILLRNLASRARYMGRTSVRNIAARYWQSATEDIKVSWFFAEDGWKYSTSNTSVTLLRMVIVGRGRSPLFVHHPFYMQGEALPENMKEACLLFMGGDMVHCDQGAAFFQHVHEFIGFSNEVDSVNFRLPDECLTISEINALPNAANCRPAMTAFSIFLLCVIVALLASFATGAFVYLRSAGKEQKQ